MRRDATTGQADSVVENLIRTELLPRGVTDPRIIAAFRAVPRQAFVLPEDTSRAYENRALAIGCGQTISQPLMIGLMLQALRAGAEDTVLEVGTGSGYQAALLSELAGSVITMERIPELAIDASTRLASLGYDRVTVIEGDGSCGYAPEAPYSRIIVSCAAPALPARLVEQLSDGGIMVAPVGTLSEQTLTVATRAGDEIRQERRGGCVFVPLVGKDGWPDTAEEPG